MVYGKLELYSLVDDEPFLIYSLKENKKLKRYRSLNFFFPKKGINELCGNVEELYIIDCIENNNPDQWCQPR